MPADVQINDVQTTMTVVDSDALLTPSVQSGIVRTVLQAVADSQAHAKRVRAETRVTGGVRHELEEEDR